MTDEKHSVIEMDSGTYHFYYKASDDWVRCERESVDGMSVIMNGPRELLIQWLCKWVEAKELDELSKKIPFLRFRESKGDA